MSRHISGWLEAMRVKSRKPPAAKEKSCAELLRFATSCTSAYASTCGRWLTAASTASCSSASMRLTFAPQADHAASTVATEALAFSFSGVSTTRRPWNSSALAAAAPLFSAPAIGCAGHEARDPLAQRLARRGDDVALGAAGVGDQRLRIPRATAKIAGNWATGAATSTRSASRAAAPGSGAMASMTPRSSASLRLAALRPTPTTVRDLPCLLQRQRERAADQADADDGDAPKLHSFKAGRERGEESLVLFGSADGDAQVLGQAVAAATGRTMTPRRSRRL